MSASGARTARSPRSANRILAQARAMHDGSSPTLELPQGHAVDGTEGSYRTLSKPLVGAKEVREIQLTAIRCRDDGQVRSADPAHGESFADLVDSIRTHGVLQPITASWDDQAQCFWVDVGHRRTAAARVAGLEVIPAVIRKRRERPHERTAELTTEQLIENVHRTDLPALDVANAVNMLLESGLSGAEIARRVGKSEGWLSQHRKILELDGRVLSKAQEHGLGTSAMYLIAQERGLSVEEQLALVEVAKLGRPALKKRIEEVRVAQRAKPEAANTQEEPSRRALRGAARRLVKVARHFESLLLADGTHESLVHSVRNLCDSVERELGVRS